MSEQHHAIVSNLRGYFEKASTISFAWRKKQLENILQMLDSETDNILKALQADLHKSSEEAWLTELSLLYMETRHALKHLKSWMAPVGVSSPLFIFPASTSYQFCPLGVVLIISPWNYPVLLALSPLISAVAAGNAAVIKPSEYSPNTTEWLRNALPKYLDKSAFAVVEGGPEETQSLLKEHFDHIFFTGSTATARHIMRAAAEQLTPITLELGGKSPCVVYQCNNIQKAAKRIAWGKFINAGQTCVAPDTLLVSSSEKDALVAEIKNAIQSFFTEDPSKVRDYARIINDRHYQRVKAMLKTGDVIYGGQTIDEERYIAPTLIENIQPDSPLLSEEIFGPILPVLTFDNIDECKAIMARNPTPLAAYLFSEDKTLQRYFTDQLSCGGVCINDTIVHISNIKVPFGGVGNSGMGRSHGKDGFETFSHKKSIIRNSLKMDVALRYAPYKDNFISLLKKFI